MALTGGGVALFALQFAVELGAEVWVTSSSEKKIERAVALGARGGVSYLQSTVARASSPDALDPPRLTQLDYPAADASAHQRAGTAS